MKVFISWSGERSKAVAEALRDWLQDIIQAVEPWISADMEKGQRWSPEIAVQLEQAQVGIICMTKDNLSSRWLHYEAGALSKTPKSFVCTFLLDIGPTDFDGPLTQFQHTKAQKEDIRRLVKTINEAQEQGMLPDSRLNKAFDRTWPDLEAQLNIISASQEQLKVQRSEREMIEEILEHIRSQFRDIKHEWVFAKSVGSELRTPLTAIFGWCSLLKNNSDSPLTSMQLQGISTIDRNARIILSISDSLVFDPAVYLRDLTAPKELKEAENEGSDS